MPHRVMAAAFEQVGKTNEIAVDVGARIRQRVAHAGLGGQMDDSFRLAACKQGRQALGVGKVQPLERESGQFRTLRQPRLLQRRVVVVVKVVDADDGVTAREQGAGRMQADEAGGAGHEDVHHANCTEGPSSSACHPASSGCAAGSCVRMRAVCAPDAIVEPCPFRRYPHHEPQPARKRLARSHLAWRLRPGYAAQPA
jgi:hypothetical protein